MGTLKELRTLSQTIYLATEAPVADDISAIVERAANELERLERLEKVANIISPQDNKPYRIETYTHSDSVTENKKVAVVKVLAETDFAVKTDEFKSFCKKLAQLACGFNTNSLDILLLETDLVSDIESISSNLKEDITIDSIIVI